MHRALVLIVLLAALGCVRTTSPPAVGDGLVKALEEGPAIVIVTLDVPRVDADAPADLGARQEQVARAQERVLAALGPEDFELIHRYRLASGLAGRLTSSGLAKLQVSPDVRAVELDVEGKGSLGGSVPQISAEEWAQAGIAGEGITVAILDTGLVDHPDLADDLVHEACILDARVQAGGLPCPDGSGQQLGAPGAALDGHGHGTNVAGIVTSAGTVAPAGVAPGAEIAAIKVFDDDKVFSTSDLIAALDYTLALPISDELEPRVVNISGSALVPAGECNIGLGEQTGDLVAMLEQNGVLVVAASGNDSERGRIGYPACVDGVFAVGAVQDNDSLLVQTNVSPKLDVLAPGHDITATGITATGILTLTGTSQAAPHVSACAALRLDDDPSLTPAELRQILTISDTFVPEPETGLSFPRLFCGQPPTI